MSVRTTNFGPRVSFTTNLADAGPVHVLVDSDSTLEAAGTNTFSGALTQSGAATFSGVNTFSGAVDSQSTTTLSGVIDIDGAVNATSVATFSGGFAVGSGATVMAMTSLNLSTISVSMGAVAGHESVSTTGTIVGLTTDSIVIAVEPQSAWSGLYYNVDYSSVVSVADTIEVVMRNSALTSVTPDIMNFTFIWVDPA